MDNWDNMNAIVASIPFALNIAAMIWGLVVQPDLQTISKRHPCVFTPSNPMVGVIFAIQIVASGYWIYRLRTPPAREDDEAHLIRISYHKPFVLANMYLAAWAILWVRLSSLPLIASDEIDC